MTVPTELTAGDTWTWTHSVTDHPATSYTAATFYLQNAARSFGMAATLSGTNFALTATAATTAALKPGKYQWRLVAITGTNRFTIDRGEVEVLPDPATAASYDFRSVARRTLEAIEAYLADPDNLAAASYSIGGRSLSRWSRSELLSEMSKWKAEVQEEEAKSRMAKGLGNPRRLYVRFDRA